MCDGGSKTGCVMRRGSDDRVSEERVCDERVCEEKRE